MESKKERERIARTPCFAHHCVRVYATLLACVHAAASAIRVQRLVGYFFDRLVPPCVGGSAIKPWEPGHGNICR